MTKSSKILLFLAVALCAALTGARAGEDYKASKQLVAPPPQPPKFWFTLGPGGEFDYHATKFISNGEGTLNYFPAASPTVGVPTAIKIQSRDFTSTHSPVISAVAEFGYHVTPALSVFAGFTYNHADGENRVRFGQVRDPTAFFGPANAVYNLYANVGNYESYAGRAGIKYALPHTLLDLVHLPPQLTSYVSYSAGGKYVEETRSTFFAPALALATPNYQLYRGSWVFTNNLQFGYEYSFNRLASLTFESGIGYDTKLSRPGSPAGLTGVNRGGDRFYSLLSLAAKIKF